MVKTVTSRATCSSAGLGSDPRASKLQGVSRLLDITGVGNIVMQFTYNRHDGKRRSGWRDIPDITALN